jgi:4'-phosphopantetheinyl transferase
LPLIHYIVAPLHTRVGVWHILEDESFFLRQLMLNKTELLEFDQFKGHRRLEWLAGRYLLQVLTGWAYSVVKDAFGKPHLLPRKSEVSENPAEAFEVSLSHSKDMSAVIVSPFAVGIDIQYMTEKVARVAPRVFNKEKFSSLAQENREEHLHIYWGAKEALYKAYGKRMIDFKKNLRIAPFEAQKLLAFQSENGILKAITNGVVEKEGSVQQFDIFNKKILNYILVYVVEKK